MRDSKPLYYNKKVKAFESWKRCYPCLDDPPPAFGLDSGLDLLMKLCFFEKRGDMVLGFLYLN